MMDLINDEPFSEAEAVVAIGAITTACPGLHVVIHNKHYLKLVHAGIRRNYLIIKSRN
jgi:hypothetical protein